MVELLKILPMSDLVELLRLRLSRTSCVSIVEFFSSRRHRTIVRIARRRRIEAVGEIVAILIVRDETILLFHLRIDHLSGIVHRSVERRRFHRVRGVEELGILIFRVRAMPLDRLGVVLVVVDRGGLESSSVARSGDGGSVGGEGREGRMRLWLHRAWRRLKGNGVRLGVRRVDRIAAGRSASSELRFDDLGEFGERKLSFW